MNDAEQLPTPLVAANYAAAELIRQNSRHPRRDLGNPNVLEAVRREHFSAYPDGIVPVEYIHTAPAAEMFGIEGDIDAAFAKARESEGRVSTTAFGTFFLLELMSCILFTLVWESSQSGVRSQEKPGLAAPLHLLFPAIVAVIVYIVMRESHVEQHAKVDKFRQATKYHCLHKASRERHYWIGLSGLEFEYALASTLQARGLSVTVTAATGDGGVDIWINLPKVKIAVQCKQLGKPCGVSAIRDLEGAKTIHRVQVAVIVSLSGFTKPAVEAADRLSISLWGLEDVLRIADSRQHLPPPLNALT